MQPAWFRNNWGFGALGTSSAILLTPTQAHAAPLSAASLSGVAPIAIAIGALGFGVLSAFLVQRWRQDGRAARKRAQTQLASLRAELDEIQAMLEGMPELTVRWRDSWSEPQIFGPPSTVLAPEQIGASVLNFRVWLDAEQAEALLMHTAQLRSEGRAFELGLTTLDQRQVRAIGRIIAGSAVLRVRTAFDIVPLAGSDETDGPHLGDRAGAEAIIAHLNVPAWVRDAKGALTYVNPAYKALASEAADRAGANRLNELFEDEVLKAHLAALDNGAGRPFVQDKAFTLADRYDLVLLPLKDGSMGYLRPRHADAAAQLLGSGEPEPGQIGSIINALATPIAIFDGRRQLVRANQAYARLWELDTAELQTGVKEQAILDRLRTAGKLPAEVDYHKWRDEHLKSYALVKPRETMWHLPDGRAINVVAVPASASGGVIYVFEDLTEQLALESRYNALAHVQSETISALSEGVAVFGTNGRLTLYNPRLADLWQLPLSLLGQHPHIDEIGNSCAKAMPKDGALIWRDLKQSIVDLDPTRTDKSGRINRADDRLIDYAAVRLPDGQTLITFVDVTESASYQRLLKEHNDALLTADKLKDDFVQNVSYELRSPLTNIIGFADLLASGSAGELNDKQKAYTDYIRTSSATLGVLIDNILDLATVDAGIAQLHVEQQNIAKLVDRAKAGLTATFSAPGADTPLNLVVDIDRDLPVFVADGTRIVQILYNLLSNAARFSEPGAEVRLTVTSRGPDRILFVVEDEGVGIPEEIKAALFQRFEGQAVKGRQRGAGLGLAIVRTFVNLHGGTISVEERAPKGTRVTVNLPAQTIAGSTDAAE